MLFYNEKEYQDALEYIEAIFTLGGLSECGKTSAGVYLEELPYNIKRYKIIHFEKDMMEARGYDLSNGMHDNHFIDLYAEPHRDEAFKEFIIRLVAQMKKDNVKRASIESLYRAPFGLFLKGELGIKCANIYISVPIELRAKRQWEKNCSKGQISVTLEETLAKVEKKDIFKNKHRASECNESADYVVDNGYDVSREMYLNSIKKIAVDTINSSLGENIYDY